MRNKPEVVRHAELIIYSMIAASALGSLVNKWLGVIGPGEFAFQLLFYALLCMIPYKLGRGSNPTRYVYVVSCVLALLLMLGGGIAVPKIDMIISVVMVPVEAYVCWLLFRPVASSWFTSDGNKVRHGN